MTRARGCRVWAADGREYVDFVMALGAVSLGYGHPRVTEAVTKAARDGVIGPLAPLLEERVAARLVEHLPRAEAVRFLKTGAEAMEAAVRIARVHTGRDRLVTCGYHGWLDTFHDARGVPHVVKTLTTRVPFNDIEALSEAVHDGDPPAAIVVEPVVDGEPSAKWVTTVQQLARDTGAVLVVDDIKTGLRLGWDGVAERYGLVGDLRVLGKALGNGLPLAAVTGPEAIMRVVEQTWISSTTATEFVSLAAADAVLDVYESEDVAGTLTALGQRLYEGLTAVAATAPTIVRGVRGIPEFCYLAFASDAVSCRFASACAAEGVLFKRNAYNFVSAAHTADIVADVLERVQVIVDRLGEEC